MRVPLYIYLYIDLKCKNVLHSQAADDRISIYVSTYIAFRILLVCQQAAVHIFLIHFSILLFFVRVAKGLYMEGGRWNRNTQCLDECLPRVQYDALPVITIEFQKSSCTVDESQHSMPLYRTNDRRGCITTTGHSTNYIMNIALNTAKLSKHWTIRGVAALCQLND